MSRQGTIRRYTLIIEKINTGQFPSFTQIQDYLYDFGFSISNRTIERDFGAIRNEFGVEITYNRFKEGYFIDEEKSINIESFIRFLEIVNTAELLTQSLSESKEALNHISFDQVGELKGVEHLPLVLRAIKDHQRIRIKHHTFYSEKSRTFKLEPYLLKEYQNRWYIVAIVCGMNEQRTFAIDRLEEIEVLAETFEPTRTEEVIDNFRNVIGLVYNGNEVEDVELSFTAFQGKYIRTLPFHSSQKILVDTEDEFRIGLRIIPNYEFTQKILMHGNTVKVLKPKWLADEIKLALQESLKNMMNKKLGDSSVQRLIESFVLDKITQLGVGEIKPNTEFSTDRITKDNKNFEVDFHVENSILGEIYACKFHLQSAQKKKVHGDFLKMITIEKIWEKGIVSKLFIMALSSNEPMLSEFPSSLIGQFIPAKSSLFHINTLGEKSWIWETIESFKIDIYYIVLPKDLSLDLEEQRRNQKLALTK